MTDFINSAAHVASLWLAYYNAGGFHYNFVADHLNLHLGAWAESKVNK